MLVIEFVMKFEPMMSWLLKVEEDFMGKFACFFLLTIILINFGCSSTNQIATTQDLEVKSVEPFAPSNEIIDANFISPELIAKSEESGRFTNPNKTITTIKGEITDEMILQGRDLSIYDKADTDKCDNQTCRDKKIREFVWQHWVNKKRGYISSGWQGIDLSVTTHIIIESNKQGEWIISWKVATNHSVLGNNITETLGIVSVKQIKSAKGKISLELRNEEGEILQTL